MVASALQAQDGPNGVDIDSAIPVWFGQKVNDTIDSALKPVQVYSIPLARGQKFTVTTRITSAAACIGLNLHSPAKRTVAGTAFDADEIREGSTCRGNAVTWNYDVPAAGTYYIGIRAENRDTGIYLRTAGNRRRNSPSDRTAHASRMRLRASRFHHLLTPVDRHEPPRRGQHWRHKTVLRLHGEAAAVLANGGQDGDRSQIRRQHRGLPRWARPDFPSETATLTLFSREDISDRDGSPHDYKFAA